MYLTVSPEIELEFSITENPQIEHNLKTNQKHQKVARFWLKYLENPNIPYRHQKVLLQVLLSPHFDKNLNTVYIPCSEIYGIFSKNRKEFEEYLQKSGDIEKTMGLTFTPVNDKKKELTPGKNAKFYAIRFDDKIKSECLKDTHGYTYLRQDYVKWFHGIVTKYNVKNAVDTQCFFILSVITSTWDITDLINIEYKKLAQKMGLKNLLESRHTSNLKKLIKKYLGYLEEEGLVKRSEVAPPTQVVFKTTNANTEKKELKSQQKREAEAAKQQEQEQEQEQEQKQEQESKKVIKLSPKNQRQDIKTKPTIKSQGNFTHKKTTQKPRGIRTRMEKRPLIT